MIGDHLDDLISGWLDDELDELARAACAAHLEVCEQCRAEVASEQAVRQLLRSLPAVEPPPGYFDALVRRGLTDRVAAQRRVRFGVANLVASAAVWVIVLGAGHLTAPSSVTPQVGTYLSAHRASVVGGSVGSSGPGTVPSLSPVGNAAASGMPRAAERFELVDYTDDGRLMRATYSDGLDEVSVFRQLGTMDWNAIDADAKSVKVGRDRGVVLERGDVEVLLFSRREYVYAVVAPPSSGVINELAVALPGSPNPSLLDRARDAGRGLLDCFGFRG
jgi:anti-sigma factor RsiW